MKYKRTIRLPEAELIKVKNITKKGTHKAWVITRARILLLSHEGKGKDVVAKACGANPSTVQRVRDRFRTGGLDHALFDDPRPGAPKKITDTVEAFLVATACSEPPEGYDGWTLELLQQELIAKQKVDTISTVAIWHHLDGRGIKPWRGKNVVRAETHS